MPPGLTGCIVTGEGPFLPASLLGLLGRPGLPEGCTYPAWAGDPAGTEGVAAAQPLADPGLARAVAVLHPHWRRRQEAKMK